MGAGFAQRPSGHLLVADHGSGAVVELDGDGAAVRRLETGLGGGRLQAIAVRSDGAAVVDDDGGTGSVFRLELPQ